MEVLLQPALAATANAADAASDKGREEQKPDDDHHGDEPPWGCAETVRVVIVIIVYGALARRALVAEGALDERAPVTVGVVIVE